MNKKIALGLCVLAGIFLTGCATTIKDLGAYRSAPMLDADVMPAREQLDAKRISVVVFDVDDASVRNPEVKAGPVMTKALEAFLSEGGSEVVDRGLAMALKDELNLAEAKGQGNYRGPAVASYAIKGSITNADYSNEYVQAQFIQTKKGWVMEPAHCSHTAKVTGVVRVYEIPSLRLVSTLNVSAPARNDTQERCNNAGAGALIREAAESAVKRVRTEMQNIFAPKGYVIEKRVNGDKVIFKVMFGTGQGAKSQDKTTIFSLRKDVNSLTQQVTYEELPVVEGKISDQITDSYSWLVPDDPEKAKRVKLGDFVKVVYKKSGLESVSEVYQDVNGSKILDTLLKLKR